MKICGYLKENHVFLDLKPGSKAEVLRQFVHELRIRKIIDDEKPILDELLRRESLGSTGLEQGIAIPHALIEVIPEPVLALSVIKSGVDFDAADQKPTYVLILILGNKDDPGMQLRILAHVCRLVKETKVVEKLRKAGTAADICSIFKEEEEKIG
jgi:mannitol/fructose-specific phosphotransferase system IIA component (Ntr-type)